MSNAGRGQLSVRWILATVLFVLVRPGLWPVALVQFRRLARPGWWRSYPFLPVPDPAYVRFRLVTMYGDDASPTPSDIGSYLEWCRSWPRPGQWA